MTRVAAKKRIDTSDLRWPHLRGMSREQGISMQTEIGWLIERASPGGRPEWWQGRSQGWWTHDANDAMRFARSHDAERALSWLVAVEHREGCKVTEHAFEGPVLQ
jgi:hypothetical protein